MLYGGKIDVLAKVWNPMYWPPSMRICAKRRQRC